MSDSYEAFMETCLHGVDYYDCPFCWDDDDDECEPEAAGSDWPDVGDPEARP